MKVRNILSWFLPCLLVVLLTWPPLASAKDGAGDFTGEELAQMLAPVALYPDGLLSQVLMAATYPLEVVAAERWVKNNPLLKGDNLDEALHEQDWDASVKALCHVPAVLVVMSERLEDTTRLGDAFLNQEDGVMNTIQDLRARAWREGNLKSDERQRVAVGDDGAITIEPADSRTVYVPYYNTRYVYGPWWYPAWPPWYWGPDELILGPDVYFWPEIYFSFGYWSRFDWPGRSIIIDGTRRPHFFRPDYKWDDRQGQWHHEPSHRRGVEYRDRATAEHFGQPPTRVERAERRGGPGRVRGPVTGSPVGADKAEGPRSSGGQESPERKSEMRLPRAGGEVLPGKPERHRDGEVATPRSDAAPKMDGLPSGPVNRERSREVGQGGSRTRELGTDEVGRGSTRSRELSTDEGGDRGYGMDRGSDGRDGYGREGRQSGPRERGDGGSEERGGFGRGGRR